MRHNSCTRRGTQAHSISHSRCHAKDLDTPGPKPWQCLGKRAKDESYQNAGAVSKGLRLATPKTCTRIMAQAKRPFPVHESAHLQLKPSLCGTAVSFHGIIVVVSVIMVVVLSMGAGAVVSSSESPQPCREDTTNAAQMATSARQNFIWEYCTRQCELTA